MVVHAEGRHPEDLHDGVEMREVETAAEECVQANYKTRPRSEEPDPARKRARQKQRGDCPGECDVNGPGDGQGAVKVKSITRVTTLRRARIASVFCSIARALLANMKSNFALRLFRRCHQLPHGINNRANF